MQLCGIAFDYQVSKTEKYMVHFRLFIPIMIILFPVFSYAFPVQSDWELKKEKNSIKVYTRDRDNSTLKEFKVVTTINTTIDKALDLLLDVTLYPEWQSNCIQSSIVEQKDVNHFYTYVLNEAPWPVSNRDIIVENQVHKNEDGSITIEMNALKDRNLVEDKENTIRMTYMVGFWKLTPRGDQVEIIQQVHADPEGKIPNWLANFAVVDSPYKTFSMMKELLEK